MQERKKGKKKKRKTTPEQRVIEEKKKVKTKVTRPDEKIAGLGTKVQHGRWTHESRNGERGGKRGVAF